ncbi:MAG: hypothetical protein ABI068_13630 [Ktedonobacterales bacterium]
MYILVLALASLIFLTAVLIGMALMMRSRWEGLGATRDASGKLPEHPMQPLIDRVFGPITPPDQTKRN